MFATRWIALLLIAAVAGFFALTAARPSGGAGPETTYVVQPGDTLWAIASARYAGDPREAIWRIKDVNELESSSLTPGAVLRLP
jgi:nucleoid-associated protein YgaU